MRVERIGSATVHLGDCRQVLTTLPADSIHCCVTSPPYYGLRDYGVVGQIGLEKSPDEYVAELVAVFREVRRVLRPDGTLWLNIGDSYTTTPAGSTKSDPMKTSTLNGGLLTSRVARASCAKISRLSPGLKPKDLMLIPARVAMALQADGWWLRSEIVWAKPNPMPESVRDRPTCAHEKVWLLAKSERYFYDDVAVAEPASQPLGKPKLTGQHKASAGGFTNNGTGNSSLGTNQGAANRNLRNVWTIATQPSGFSHYAMMPPELAARCIRAGTSAKGCCPSCRASWARVKERQRFRDGKRLGGSWEIDEGGRRLGATGVGHWRDTVAISTVGWRPSCACPPHDPVPCTVLDIFAGGGTTLFIADRLQRRSVGIELNPSYTEIIRQRFESDAPLLMGAA